MGKILEGVIGGMDVEDNASFSCFSLLWGAFMGCADDVG